jgi:hypothetical protein
MRNDDFLRRQLDALLEQNFADMPRPNEIRINFGRRAKRRFGSIKMGKDKRVSQITINGVFRDERIPEQIICATIAHELCHYAHGFCSPLPKKYSHPHQGGVIERELKKRDLHYLSEYEKIWSKNNWPKIVGQEFPPQRQRRRPAGLRRRRKSFLEQVFDLL